MRETFLVQMKDFDRLLELRLRQMLDPVVAQKPPARRRTKKPAETVVAIPAPSAELAPEAIPVIASLSVQP